MPYVLGIDVGTSRARAAISRETPTGWTDPAPVPLGSRQPAVPAVVYLGTDRSALVGEDAEQQAGGDPIRVARGAVGRIGDDVPMVLGGVPCTPQELTAVLVRWAVDRAAQHEGEPAATIVVTHPSEWGAHRKSLLHHELVRQDLTDVILLAEPIAVAEGYTGPIDTGGALATYGLGAGGADAAVVRKTPAGTFELLADARGVESVGGGHFDDAVMQCVRDQVGHALDGLDPADPDAWLIMARLRGMCTGAKEALSTRPAVTIPVRLPSQPDVPPDVRVTRPEFERVIRPAVAAGVDLVPRTVRAAGVTGTDLVAVVLCGGSVRVPLVAELIGESAPATVIVAPEPDFTVAAGAAIAARRVLIGIDQRPLVGVVAGTGTAAAPFADAEFTAVIERSAIAEYAGGHAMDIAAVDAEFGTQPPERPPVDVLPIELPEPPLLGRLLTGARPAALTVGTIALAAVGVVLTFMLQSGSGAHTSTTNPLHAGPATNQSAPAGGH